MKKNSLNVALAIALLIPAAFALAQSDGSAPTSSSGGAVPDPSAGGSAPAPIASTTAATSSGALQTQQTTLGSTTPTQPRSTTSKATSTIPPRSIPVGAPSAPTSIQATATAEAPTIPSSSPSAANSSLNLITFAGIAIAGILAALGIQQFKKGKQNNNQKNDDGRCDNVKQLLEQKKKELEDMVRGWPEEKIKAMALGKIIDTVKKDDDAKQVIEAAESAKTKYDKLKGTIDLLEKRLDLCMLSLPEKGEAHYEGTIIENSLTDKAILENIKILKTYEAGEWILHDVSVNEKQIKKLGGYLSDGPWYMHFWQPGKDKVIAVFKDKNFEMKQSDAATRRAAIEHGKSKGIPESQLNFKIK